MAVVTSTLQAADVDADGRGGVMTENIEVGVDSRESTAEVTVTVIRSEGRALIRASCVMTAEWDEIDEMALAVQYATEGALARAADQADAASKAGRAVTGAPLITDTDDAT